MVVKPPASRWLALPFQGSVSNRWLILESWADRADAQWCKINLGKISPHHWAPARLPALLLGHSLKGPLSVG